jgi:putative membrane protein
MSKPRVLREGKIDRAVKKYWLLATPIIFACTIVLIPLIPVYLIIAGFLVDRYIDNIECTLTERNLIIKKGILNKVESTVPLEKITDLQMFQGPIMRHFGIKGFRVETAGQSSGPGGHLVNMIGIADTDGFRDAVLAQRDLLQEGGSSRATSPAPSPQPADAELTTLAREIRDTLARIEQKLDKDRPSA